MIPEELMLGDWVIYHTLLIDSTYWRIAEIHRHGLVLEDKDGNLVSDVPFFVVRPVPITEEWLEEQGFIYEEVPKVYYKPFEFGGYKIDIYLHKEYDNWFIRKDFGYYGVDKFYPVKDYIDVQHFVNYFMRPNYKEN